MEAYRAGASNLQTFANHEVALHGFDPGAAGQELLALVGG